MVFNKKVTIAAAGILMLLLAGYLMPESMTIPVLGASSQDWNHDTFWHEPWGKSGVHKGIDIFSSKGTPVVTATNGVVVFKGYLKLGGNVVVVLGPKWRIHYYAHLDTIGTHIGDIVGMSERLGTVGNTGNAQGKPAHLHYSILSLFPYPWRWDGATQGWLKMVFLNPSEKLLSSTP
jgi:murein DD-endopeptidase MepM/ murein hydrolase activator NlpD